MEKELKSNKKYSVLLICSVSFCIGAAGMLLILWGSRLVWGDYSLVKGDVMYNYIPAIRNLCRDILSGNSIFYTWTYGLGTNTSLYNAYYSLSPVNVLYLIFYKADMNSITAVNIVLKTGLAAAAFSFFAKKAYATEDIWTVLFSLFYSLCSFQIASNTHNIIWLDAMYVLPVVAYFIYKLVETGEYVWLTFWLAYIFASQFYMGYMIGIFSVLFLGVCLYTKHAQIKYAGRMVIRFIVAVLIAVGISAIIWLPTIMFLSGNAEAGVSTFAPLKCNLLDVFNQLFWGEVTNFDTIFPYIYCGTPALLLVPMFFMNKNIEKREKGAFAIALAVLSISCVVLPVYAMWHGFDEPDLYAFRFSYIFSFLLCVICVKQISNMEGDRRLAVWGIVFIELIIYVIEMYWQKRRIDSSLVSNSFKYMAINIVLIAIWFIALGMYRKITNDWMRIAAAVLICGVALVELVSNGIVILETKGHLNSAFSKEAFDAWDSSEKIVTNALGQDESFYRVAYLQDMNSSSGTYYGFNSMAYFGSAENVTVRKTLSGLGMWTSPRTVTCYGLTPVTEMLLDVKYNAFNAIPLENGMFSMAINPTDNDLGIGFIVECSNPEELNLNSNNAFENINDVLKAMTGTKENVFERVEDKDIEVINNGIAAIQNSDQLTFVREADAGSISYVVNDDADRLYYGYVENKESQYNPDSFYIKDDERRMIYTNGSIGVSFIKELIHSDDTYELEIVARGSNFNQSVDDLYIYRLNEENFEKCYEKLSTCSLQVDKYSDGYIKGSISTDGEKKLLYTSIPYEKGWNAYVDGIKTQILPIMNGAFSGLNISQSGTHQVEFEYRAPGLLWGEISTIICVGIWILILFKQKN